MRRRDFVKVIAGSTAAWPLAARAQQADRLRRIGMLMAWAETDPEVQPRMAAFMTTLRELGWDDGRNCRFEVRWSATQDQPLVCCFSASSGCCPLRYQRQVLKELAGILVQCWQQSKFVSRDLWREL